MRKGIILLLLFGMILMIGCQARKDISQNQLPYDLVIINEAPELLQDKILEEKETPFAFMYVQGKDLYIAVGYGEKPSGGYSIRIVSIQEEEDRIKVITELISPKPDEVVVTVLTYPFVIIKTKDMGVPVEVERRIRTQ